MEHNQHWGRGHLSPQGTAVEIFPEKMKRKERFEAWSPTDSDKEESNNFKRYRTVSQYNKTRVFHFPPTLSFENG